MELRSEPLTLVFKGFTSLGGVVFLGVAMASGYWLWRKKLFAELILLYCLSGLLNNHLKETWRVPRPFQTPDAGVTALVHVAEGSWSFPSGHAQTAALLWGWFAVSVGRAWAYAASGVVILLVAASRVYLGVHYPIDVVAGSGLGLAGVALFGGAKLVRARCGPSLSPAAEVALLLAVVVAWLLVFPGEKAPRYVFGYGGGLLGFWGGYAWDRARWRVAARLGLTSSLGILAVGLGIPSALYLTLPESPGAWAREIASLDRRALAYLALTVAGGVWVSLGAPAIFLRAGWARREGVVTD